MSHSVYNQQTVVEIKDPSASSHQSNLRPPMSLIDAVPVALYRANEQGKISEGNIALATLLGYPDLPSLLADQENSPSLSFLAKIDQNFPEIKNEKIATHRGQASGQDGQKVQVTTRCTIYLQANGERSFDGSLDEIHIESQTAGNDNSSKEMLETVLDLLPIEIWWKDTNHNYLGCNSQLASSAGFDTPSEIIGKSDFELAWTKEEATFFRHCDRQVMEKGKAEFNIIETKRNSDGSSGTVKTNKIPLRNSFGDVIGVLGTCEQIGDNDKTTNPLGLMETVVENSPVIVFRWLAEEGWPVAFVSDNISTLGYSPEELVSGEISYASIVHPDDIERVGQEVVEYSLQGRETFVQEYRLLTRSGEIRWFDDRTKVEYREDGSVLHYQGVMLDITDRKKIEKELLQFRSVIENATALIGIADLATLRHTYLNPAGLKLLGYDSCDQINSLHISAFQDKDTLDVLENDILPVVLKDGIWRGENRLLCANGSTVPVDQSLFTINDSQGKPEYMATFVTDITEQKKSFDTLRLNEARLETLVTLNKMTKASIEELVDFIMVEALNLTESNLGYLICLADESITAHNYSFESADSKSDRSPTITNTIIEKREQVAELLELKQPVIANESPAPIGLSPLILPEIAAKDRVMHIPIFDGEHMILIAGVANKTCDYDENDLYQLTLLLQGMYSLIKGRKDQEALQISQGLLSEAQALTDMAIWEYNLKTEEIKWSGGVVESLRDAPGTTESNLDTLLHYLHPEDVDKFKVGMTRAIHGDQFRDEFRITHQDGTHSTYLGSTKALADNTGKVVRMIGIGQDITELKNIEEELRKHRDHLEDLVLERTTELAAAKELAESANTARSAFFTNMSHELRTPLTSILGFSRLLERDQGISKHQQEKLRVIQKSGEHLLALINDVLDMSKIEANKVEIINEDFDVSLFIQDIADVFQIQAEEKFLKFNLSQKSGERFIRCDRDKLRQVLINLLGNSVKFTSKGYISLQAQLQNSESSKNCHLQLIVQDTGRGIGQENLTTIFEPYTQSTQKFSEQAGTGLGLAICQRLIKLMGGKIAVLSEPGQGTTFTISLPVQLVDNSTAVHNTITSQRVTGLASNSQSCSVLVVEDNEMSRLLLYELLSTVGITVYQATNGREGIEAFVKWQPDIVLMDMRMPEVDGLEATRQIKNLQKGRHTPIVAITAQALKEEMREIMSAGCDDFITKPFSEENLFSVLGRHLHIEFTYSEMPTHDSSEIVSPIFVRESLLERVMGDHDFFIKMLNGFIQSYDQVDQKIKHLLESGDLENASLLVHTIKGGAATISADQLSKAAAKLEQEIKNQAPDEPPNIKDFARVLKETLNTLRSNVRETAA